MKKVCDNCQFFDPEAEKCRRYPPSIVRVISHFIDEDDVLYSVHTDQPDNAEFPSVAPDYWCGEYRGK